MPSSAEPKFLAAPTKSLFMISAMFWDAPPEAIISSLNMRNSPVPALANSFIADFVPILPNMASMAVSINSIISSTRELLRLYDEFSRKPGLFTEGVTALKQDILASIGIGETSAERLGKELLAKNPMLQTRKAQENIVKGSVDINVRAPEGSVSNVQSQSQGPVSLNTGLIMGGA